MKEIFPFYHIGHFFNDPENPREFDLSRFEEMEEPDIEDPHKHHFYEILWVTSGTSKQVIDYKEYRINPGSLFFISPGQLHHFEEWHDLKGGSVFFTENFFLLNQARDQLFEMSYLDNLYSNPTLKLPKDDFKDILNTIDLLEKEKNRVSASQIILSSYLNILLNQIQRCVDKQTREVVSRHYTVTFKKFKETLNVNFNTEWTVSNYAAQLNITQHQLNRVCKAVTGQTASQIILGRKILEAKRLLTFTDFTIGEISWELKFFDISYFGKVFKKMSGATPGQFRASMSEKYQNL